MAISEFASGTESIGATEWSLTTDTSGPDSDTNDGVYQVFLDLNAVANGDVFRFKVYEKVLSSSTQRTVWEAIFANAQAEPVWVSPALTLLHGWDFTLQKVSGTDRSIDWSIRRVSN